MIRIPGGAFWMGSEGRYVWESPKHQVHVDAFDISPTAVTRREYADFLRATSHEEPKGWHDAFFAMPEQPVVGVSWFDAMDYCEWCSSVLGEVYRLPTEAEWEKACRGGRVAEEYAWGNEPPDTIDYFRGEWTGPRQVAAWRANDFGLFNMGDNVHEWCLDWFGADYYATAEVKNPSGPLTGTRRVSRGGSWRHQFKYSRAAHRSSLPPNFRYTDYGFRIVRGGEKHVWV